MEPLVLRRKRTAICAWRPQRSHHHCRRTRGGLGHTGDRVGTRYWLGAHLAVTGHPAIRNGDHCRRCRHPSDAALTEELNQWRTTVCFVVSFGRKFPRRSSRRTVTASRFATSI